MLLPLIPMEYVNSNWYYYKINVKRYNCKCRYSGVNKLIENKYKLFEFFNSQNYIR